MKKLPCGECGGQCCSYPAMTDFELQKMQSHNVKVTNIKKMKIANDSWVLLGTCPFLREGRCSVYEARPSTCRKYGESERIPCQYLYPAKALKETEDMIIRGLERQ